MEVARVMFATRSTGDNRGMTYNGYATRSDFIAAIMDKYADDYLASLDRSTPEGMRHAGCDHANGYCAG